MALFPLIREVKYFPWPSGYGAFTLNASSQIQSTLVIPRQSRRLETIRIHANVTIASPTSTASRDGLENIFPKIQLLVSDAAGSNRSHTSTNSATLLIRNRLNIGRLDSPTYNAFGAKAAGTYDLFFDVQIRNMLMAETIGQRTLLPLYAPVLSDDPKLVLTLAGLNDIGLSAGTVTVNFVNTIFSYREAPAEILYVPTEFVTNDYAWGGGSGQLTYDIPQNGLLAGILHEGFTSGTARGSILGGSGGSGLGHWKLKFGRSDRQEWYDADLAAVNQLSAMALPNYSNETSVGPLTNAWMLDLLHDTPFAEAVSPGSLYSLYSNNAGDRAQLVCTNLAAGGTSKISTYKFLTTTPGDLVGA